jgi:hypothetical protein
MQCKRCGHCCYQLNCDKLIYVNEIPVCSIWETRPDICKNNDCIYSENRIFFDGKTIIIKRKLTDEELEMLNIANKTPQFICLRATNLIEGELILAKNEVLRKDRTKL